MSALKIIVLSALFALVCLYAYSLYKPERAQELENEKVLIKNLAEVCETANICLDEEPSILQCNTYALLGLEVPTEPKGTTYFANLWFDTYYAWYVGQRGVCTYECRYDGGTRLFGKVKKSSISLVTTGCHL